MATAVNLKASSHGKVGGKTRGLAPGVSGHLQEKCFMFLTVIGGWKVLLGRKLVKQATRV